MSSFLVPGSRTPSPEIRSRLLELRATMDTLARQSLAPWIERAQDPLGGVHGFLDRRFEPIVDSDAAPAGPSGEVRGDKSLIQQARHLYSYSLAAERLGITPDLGRLARSVFALLEERFWRGEGEPMVHQLSANHELRKLESQIYAQSFAIYGLSTFARVFEHERAGSMALSLYKTMDARFHDRTHGGYDQRDDGGWLTEVLAPSSARKCTNTHIHILEALTPLQRLFPKDACLGERLSELVKLICTRLLQPEGYVHKHFALDWTKVGEPECSYGHDLETSWLVREAAVALGEEERRLVERSARTMAEHALSTGWDPAGGVFDFGPPKTGEEPPAPVGLEKVWWAQAETLPGLLCLYFQTREEGLITKMEGCLGFLKEKLQDKEFGDFYWGVHSDGSLGPRGDHKGEMWKTPYHALRALILSRDWIDKALGQLPPDSR